MVAASIQLTSLETALGIILLTFLLVVFCNIFFGLINIAGYEVFSLPVVSGFMSGVGLIIILLQLFPFVGLNSAKSTFAILEFAPTLKFICGCFRHFDSVNLLFNPTTH
jgi:SulP family sulfate permease